MNRLGARIFVLHGNMNVVAVNEDFYFEIFSELADAAASDTAAAEADMSDQDK